MTTSAAPGSPPLTDPTDVISRRAVAKIIDYVIAVAVASIGFIALLHSFQSHDVVNAADYCNQVTTSSHFCVAIGPSKAWEFDQPSRLLYLPSLVLWFFIAWTEGRWGWTPGKLALGLRVIRQTDGQACGFGRSVVRNLLWIVDGLIFGMVALLVANRSTGHRRLGDNAAGTLVVDRAAFGTPPVIPGLAISGYLAPGMAPPMTGTPLPFDTPVWDAASQHLHPVLDHPPGLARVRQAQPAVETHQHVTGVR